jgi:endonuclease YncB( thermonuclease family)
LYRIVSGNVVNIVDGETVTIRVKNKRKLIHLVGIDAPEVGEPLGRESRTHLESLISGKVVEIWYKGYHPEEETEITGIVKMPGDRVDINLEQVRSGMARYKNFGPYAQSARDVCLYRLAEEEAKKARRGIWRGAA